MFCDLNKIEDVNGLILGCIKGGFCYRKIWKNPSKGRDRDNRKRKGSY